ncbi:MAG TPA: phosphatase PAP2 family protein [Sphingomicrobium sp.]|nr:phosphatase PAP2 family protein [Sphingomicrobium sp.]
MYGLDVTVTQAINGLVGKSAFIDLLMIWISKVGVPVLVAAVAFQWWRRTNRLHVRHVLVASGASFLLGLAFNQLVLLFVHRVRPYDAGITHLLVAKNADPSFPSDHATASIAIATAFLVGGLRRTGFCFLLAAALLMISRVYIGIHYASDVVGGAVTGSIAATLVVALYREGTLLDRALTRIL